MNQFIEYSKEVLSALENHTPIVAIETGGTFAGIPYPENVETARKVCEAVRATGSIPAYISIMKGKIKVGMSDEELDDYGKRRGSMAKASRREIPLILAKGEYGVMTLAATMVIADLVNIPVVSGGGMGGVHRGAEVTMDISSDLEEIAERNVIVVCSGAKSILDLNLTMEYLETKSVPVMGYKTEEMPAYMAIESGIKLPCKMDSVSEVAKAYRIKNDLKIETGMILMNPISKDYAVDATQMNKVIDEAIECSKKDNIRGKAITEYLMKYVKQHMGAESMDAQKNMILENAVLAAQLAVELEKSYNFYGWQTADVSPENTEYKSIKNPRELYDLLLKIWCAETCAPRMRGNWKNTNPTYGQCSITAFLAQDIFGGEVYGILRDGGNYHCYNVIGDCVFDLTSEQFGEEKLSYENNPVQSREVHFAKEEKRLRYEYLKEKLNEIIEQAGKNEIIK